MAMTEQQAKSIARDFANVKPSEAEKDKHFVWQKMVFAVANHGVPSTMAKAFYWACYHSGVWLDHL